jgi:serine/threonine protein kinase
LWKAHVEDGGNSRHVSHNIFKSDVFSGGLIFYQCAAMEDVTGFNQRNQVNDGEKLVDQGLKKLKQRYSDHIIEIIRLMLKFEEADRPSFVELSKLVLTSTENTIDSPKPGRATGASHKSLAGGPQTASHSKNLVINDKKVSKTFSMQNFKENLDGGAAGGLGAQLN